MILSDGFEGSFPGYWQTYSPNPATTWGRSTYRAASGSASAWCAGGGSSPRPSGGPYAPNMDTGLRYGPFSLSDAISAQLEFDIWYATTSDVGHRRVGALARQRELLCGGFEIGKRLRLERVTFNFANESRITAIGSSQAWVSFAFGSDGSGQAEGVYIDNVVISKTIAGNGCTFSLSPTSASFAAGPGVDRSRSAPAPRAAVVGFQQHLLVDDHRQHDRTGSRVITYNVAANTSASPRTGTLTLAGQTFSVTQAGASGGTGSYRYLVPAIAHAPGTNNTSWRSDLSIVNRSSSRPRSRSPMPRPRTA